MSVTFILHKYNEKLVEPKGKSGKAKAEMLRQKAKRLKQKAKDYFTPKNFTFGKARCHPELVEGYAGGPLHTPFDKLRMTPLL